MRVSPEDQHLLTCIIPALRVSKWLRLPFGLKHAGTHFQSVMNKNLFKDMIAKGILLIYADDILVASQSSEQHKEHLKLLAKLLKGNGIKISVRKSHFFVDSFDFLTFKLTPERVQVSDEKAKAVREYARPTDIQSVQKFEWKEKQQRAFEAIKEAIAERITLSFFDFSKEI